MKIDWEELRNMVGLLAIAIVISSVAWSIASYNMDTNSKIDAAIKAGANPIDAYCAYSGGNESKPCLIRSVLKGEVK